MKRQVRAQVIAIIRAGKLSLFQEKSRQDVKKKTMVLIESAAIRSASSMCG